MGSIFGYGILWGALAGVLLTYLYLLLAFSRFNRIAKMRYISYADRRAQLRIEALRKDFREIPITTTLTVFRWPVMYSSLFGFAVENFMRLFLSSWKGRSESSGLFQCKTNSRLRNSILRRPHSRSHTPSTRLRYSGLTRHSRLLEVVCCSYSGFSSLVAVVGEYPLFFKPCLVLFTVLSFGHCILPSIAEPDVTKIPQ